MDDIVDDGSVVDDDDVFDCMPTLCSCFPAL